MGGTLSLVAEFPDRAPVVLSSIAKHAPRTGYQTRSGRNKNSRRSPTTIPKRSDGSPGILRVAQEGLPNRSARLTRPEDFYRNDRVITAPPSFSQAPSCPPIPNPRFLPSGAGVGGKHSRNPSSVIPASAPLCHSRKPPSCHSRKFLAGIQKHQGEDEQRELCTPN